jgi:hypothetical protein
MRLGRLEFIWWPTSRPRWKWNGIWFSRDMGALSFLYRWRLMLGWVEIRRWNKRSVST